jgi:hypothetical protein
MSDELSAGEIEWPTEKGIWMAWFESMDCWFPIKAKLLKEYPEGEPHLPMPIVAQFPESVTSWPYTFKGCHLERVSRRDRAVVGLRGASDGQGSGFTASPEFFE